MKRIPVFSIFAALAVVCLASDITDLRPPWGAALVASFNRGDATDRSWAANVPTLNGNASVSTYLTLDGTGDYVSYPDAAALDMPTAFSISLWVEPSTPGSSSRALVTKYDTGSGSFRSYEIWAEYSAGYYQAIVTRDGTLTAPYLNYRWAATLPTSGWHHIAWVVDTNAAGTGTRMKLYVDNVALTASTIFSDSSAFTPQDNAIGFFVGAFEGGSSAWKGNMDSVVVHRSAITANEVAAIYAEGRR